MSADGLLRLAAVGDIMLGDSSHFLGRGVGALIRSRGAGNVFAATRENFRRSDLFLGNLESPLAASPGRSSWERVYRAPAEAAAALQLAPTNVVSLANNHILEHGSALLRETKDILRRTGVAFAGFGDDGGDGDARWRSSVNGVAVTVLAASLVRDIARGRVSREEREAWLVTTLRADDADVRIVSLHWGDEYVGVPSPEQRTMARRLVDAGATVVVGHHPHVLQPVERIGNGLVAYSLGNFVFDQDWTDATRLGGILQLDLRRGEVLAHEFVPTWCGRRRVPEPAVGLQRQAALAAVDPARLTEAGDYGTLLRRAQKRHRIHMKTELLRKIPRVSRDTWHFLLTKRRRPRPIVSACPDRRDES